MDDPISRVVEPVARVAAIVCGYAVLLLSLAVSVEIVGRKLFSHSFPGTDDIGGYVLAIVAIVGASYTMAKRGHTRVDIFLVRMPTAWQRMLNLLAMVTMAAFAIFAAWRGTTVLLESIEFQSVASNPLQTPLWQPQSLWLIGLVLFASSRWPTPCTRCCCSSRAIRSSTASTARPACRTSSRPNSRRRPSVLHRRKRARKP